MIMFSVLLGCILSTLAVFQFADAQGHDEKPSRLAIVWTSADPDVAHKMAFMYVHASQGQGWFDENLVIVWGPSSKLLSTDEKLQEKVKAMMKSGVKFQACKACSDSYGVSGKLSELGIEVLYMGRPLTNILKDDGWEVMTF